ncbi:16S rRNA (guanine(527)-N(7))-methyltransferase RsmG [Loktanella sp. TSTF-M6]|uniref:Ribosomal RNA small subunit methyltransferase G n=1 Tax=Loktanella gaetbuli TaxID=2881335 RepID=A0ABS8BUF5_9RHOB|nr:16S rRNA (guanine(527)-N(7))-methyltransferase RsmG [Loktanella gaetbuli]MCB5199214.1 16S rRNA (guanine(527)-N(7))-methyltransferase RsmG [Loktanella gaetbuli]
MSVERRALSSDVSRETLLTLEQFSALLLKWNAKINLVARSQVSDIWTRHVQDSLQLLPHIPEHCDTLTDIGSGGGFPGVVIAIAAKTQRPEMRVQLIESDQRKAAFLRTAARTFDLNVDVFAERITDTTAVRAQCVTARALAPLTDLLGFAAQLLEPSGVAIFPKGQSAPVEVATARESWQFSCDATVSQTDPDAQILVIKDISRA